jgi:uncharacterized damage-inducible protein DinB
MFLAQSREYLSAHYLPKILAAVEQLSDADLWWRPNENSNSLGNLLLHLAGNITQWIVSGVGGVPGDRNRMAEFAQREPIGRTELLARFTAAVHAADAVLGRTDTEALAASRTIQGREVTVFSAIYHVIEHFSMHAGQIIYIAKLRTGSDLGFYRVQAGVVRPAWPGHPTSGSA